jgi:uncharacterized protein with beta-barrel porin domain
VAGPFILNPGSAYEVEVDPAGNGDKTIVAGSVNLTGSVLRVLAATGDYAAGKQYIIIDNDGVDPVTGTFAKVTTSSPFLTPTVVYDGGTGNDVVLTLSGNTGAFVTAARTRNQRAVAAALADSDPTSALVLAVLPLTAPEARTAFDALSGEIHATVSGVLADDGRYLREAILGRLVQAAYTGNANQVASLGAVGPQIVALDTQAMALGYDDKSFAPPPAAPGLVFWTRAYGAWGDFDAI